VLRKTVAAVVHEQDAPFSLEEVEIDEPRGSEVLVRMVAAGLCHTDLSARSGVVPFPLPGVMGHEGAGVVEAIGAGVRRVAPGDQVLASFSSCGVCPECGAGRPFYCRDFLPLNLFAGTRADGTHTLHLGGTPISGHFFGQSSFARHALVDERCLVRMSPEAPLRTLAPLGCGIQTGAGAVLNALRPEPGCTLVVFGTGAVGAAAIMAAALSGAARIVAVDLLPERLELARDLGATHTVDAGAGDAVDALMEMSSGRGVDYTIEATGSRRPARRRRSARRSRRWPRAGPAPCSAPTASVPPSHSTPRSCSTGGASSGSRRARASPSASSRLSPISTSSASCPSNG
jgi:aryl-alcohol dehydrogenase